MAEQEKAEYESTLRDTAQRLTWLRDALKKAHRPSDNLNMVLAASLVDLEVQRLIRALDAANHELTWAQGLATQAVAP